jgi:hypothetical protein
MTYSDMSLNELIGIFSKMSLETKIQFCLPNGTYIPKHFHVTEIGRIQKDFVDCGGVKRKEEYCSMQLWVAGDVDHQIALEKLMKIIEAGSDLDLGNLPVMFEYQTDTLGLYFVNLVQIGMNSTIIHLRSVYANCLAPDKCGVGQCGVPVCAIKKPEKNKCCGDKEECKNDSEDRCGRGGCC